MGRALLAAILALSTLLPAAPFTLSGKVRDAEEGDGLKNVEVSLAVAGLRTTTAKNGDWSLSGTLDARRCSLRTESVSDGLFLRDGRLGLRLSGRDLLGRPTGDLPTVPPAPSALRAAAAAVDTLVLAREGFFPRRIPLDRLDASGRVDSLRRIRYAGWVDSSHSNGFPPDTLDAFPDTLRTLLFRFAQADWDRMMKTMADSCGAFGKSSGGGFGTSTTCQESQYDLISSSALLWVGADLVADGQVWKNIGIRLKGNASLMTTWSKGSYALPFRIVTDKWEDSLPETKNQRFHGFRKLSFYNLEQDSSGVRGAVAGEVFRQAGVAAPLDVPVRIRLDRGDGRPLDVGVYEMLEVPDAPLLHRLFGNDSGNLYKPLSKLDRFVESEWADDDVDSGYADARALIAAIAAPERTSSPAAWRSRLEGLLDVRGFLRWLAVSTAIMNWDAYGTLAHNYYLFDDRGVFRWITYDFGWSFDYAMGFLPRSTVWYDQSSGFMDFGPFPLVKNLLADSTYCGIYRRALEEAIADGGPASAASFQEKVDRYGRMVSSQASTVAAVAKLRPFMAGRIPEIRASLSARACPVR